MKSFKVEKSWEACAKERAIQEYLDIDYLRKQKIPKRSLRKMWELYDEDDLRS